jgi:oligopeptide transport system substrate-binding protein
LGVFRLAAACLVPALLAAGCQPGKPAVPAAASPFAAQPLRVALDEAPRSYDPALQYLPSEAEIGRLYAEPLLRPAPDLSDVLPGAAQSYEVSADGLTYTFHLRADGRYSDGRPVVAADFVFAWRRLIDPRVAAPHAELFAASVLGGVDAESFDPKYDAARIDPALRALGLKAPDDYTFQVVLPEPQGYFKWIATLWNGAPLREEVVKAPGWASKPETLISNGPYRLTGMGTFVSLEANPHYWGGRPHSAEVIARVTPDAAEGLSRFQDGRLEMAGVPPSLAVRVSGDASLASQLERAPRLTEHWIDFNVQSAPFDNLKVRQAFAQAIDRSQYIKDAWKDEAQPAAALVPAGMPGHPASGAANQVYDAPAARSLLAASGEEASQFAGLQLLVADQPFDRAAAALIKAQLQTTLGIDLAVQPLGPLELSARLHHGDYQIAGPLGWTADYPDPQDWLDLFRSHDGRDYPHWRNQRYDLLVQLADQTLDSSKRLQAYAQAQQVLLADIPIVLLDQAEQWTLVKPYVKGVEASPYDAGPFIGNLSAAKITVGRH